MKFPADSCGIPALGPAGIINHKRAIHMAGIACNNHRGGNRRRCPGVDAVDFSWFASINGLVSDSGIVGRDVRVVEVGLAELIIGNHGNGTEAPLPSRNDGIYMRSVLVERIGLEDSVDDSVDEGCGSLSFCTVAPDGNSRRVHVRRVSRDRRGRQAPGCSEREASCMRARGKRDSANEGIGYDSVTRVVAQKWSPAAGWDSCLEPSNSGHPSC